ncbi:MAG: methyltransferase domain-containing protein [Actinobacteria bacterium]|nr:methyltransferase domain-containing protein [Actinomycetota bacterium]
MADRSLYENAVDLEAHETQGHYDKWASSYDEDLDLNRYALPTRCADAAERFVPDRSGPVLDLGCGTGLVGSALRCRGYTTIDGRDHSAAMLAEAEATGAYSRLCESDLNSHPLDIADCAYNLVTAVGAIGGGHVHAVVVDEVVRILKTGSFFVICLNEPWWLEGSLSAMLSALEDTGVISLEMTERGIHMPSHDVMGWVVVGRKL